MNIVNPYIDNPENTFFEKPDKNLAKAYKELSRLKY